MLHELTLRAAGLTLEAVPLFPELGHNPRVAELTGVGVDSPSSVDLAQLALHLCETTTHLRCLLVRQRFQCPLVDRSCGRQAKVGRRLRNVDREHLELVRVLDCRRSTVVYPHSALCKTVLLFQLGVHEVEGLAELLRAVLQRLLEQIPRTFQLLAAVSLDELGQVDVPDFESDREIEQFDASLVDLPSAL